MMRWLAVLLLSALPVMAQQEVSSAGSATVRVLDKISGVTDDIEIGRSERKTYGRLSIVLGDCRYPTNNPHSDAFGWLAIRDEAMAEPAFSGWMVASSPALNAMDNPRYDVWLLRCNNT